MKTITISTQTQQITPSMAARWANHSREETRKGYEEKNPNIDPSRSGDNVTILDNLKDKTIADFVNEVYKEDVDFFNENRADKRPSREVKDYARQRLHSDKRQKEPYNEFVFAYGSSADVTKDGLPHYDANGDKFGNIDTKGTEWNTRKNALIEFGNKLPELLPNFRFYYIELHLDETNPHLHAGAVGFTPMENKDGKNRLRHSPGVGAAYLATAEENGHEIAKGKAGQPLAVDALRYTMNEYLGGEMMLTYNQHAPEKAERAKPRPKREKLTMQEYRKLVAPISHVASQIAEAHQKALETIEKLTQIMEAITEAYDLDEEFLDKVNEVTKDNQEQQEKTNETLKTLETLETATTIEEIPAFENIDINAILAETLESQSLEL